MVAARQRRPLRSEPSPLFPLALCLEVFLGGYMGAPPYMSGFTNIAHSTRPCTGAPPSMSGFPHLDFSWRNQDVSSPEATNPVWDKDVHPAGGFMSYFASSPVYENNDASSPPSLECLNGNGNVRTEKRIMWTMEEDVRVMSVLIEHSTNSSCGADKSGIQYWGDVVESYNRTTPTLGRRNLKQCKDRWHKINRWTDLFECVYVKARRIFTSGYSDQMWVDAAHKFYVDDNKKSQSSSICSHGGLEDVQRCPKWKTYNEELKNACKRKSFHLEGDSQEDDSTPDEMPKRPLGQKAAKKAALAANGKLNCSSSSDDGQSKESPIELDKFDRYSKFQEENNEKRIKLLDRQDKLSLEKLEATKIAHLTAQEYKEGKKLEKESK